MAEGDAAAIALAEQLVEKYGVAGAHAKLEEAFAVSSVLELAALEHDFPFWARPVQMPPPAGWRSWGALGARGIGKTRMFSEFTNTEAREGRAWRIGLAAQNEDKCVEVQIEGKSGLLATAQPWFRPKWESSKLTLTWPNGATGIVYTPEAPDPIYGAEIDLAWLSDVHAWPKATAYQAYANFLFATRAGAARTLWDANPKRGSAVVRALRARSRLAPEKHVIVGGRSRDNEANLGAGVIADWEAEFGGTQKGREDLEGIVSEEEGEHVVAQQAWIADNRRPRPDRLRRRGIGVDPAITKRAGSDCTGIVDAGLGLDGQGLVLGDYTGKYDAGPWANLVLDLYVAGDCDIVVCETNKGGDLVVQNLRAAAEKRHLHVVVLGKKEIAKPHMKGIVQVREVYSRGTKADRAQPLSTAYEAGRVSHVLGVELKSLETTLTTWEPTPNADSPDDLDALTNIMIELLDLAEGRHDPKKGFQGIVQAAKALQKPTPQQRLMRLEEILGRGRRGI